MNVRKNECKKKKQALEKNRIQGLHVKMLSAQVFLISK